MPKTQGSASSPKSRSGFDIFISHASEDKAAVAKPLADALARNGLRVWLDQANLRLGDSLRRNIDRGLEKSRYGVVILSPHFFAKDWTQNELDALISREEGSQKVILPVRHHVTPQELKSYSPLLANRLSISTEDGIEAVAKAITEVVKPHRQSKATGAARPIVVGISGPSCSGKTWLAQKIARLRPRLVTVFDLDSYYKEARFVERLEHRHDNPASIDFEDALVSLALLRSGKQVSVPEYDFDGHVKRGARTLSPAPVILVEGLFVFANERLLAEMDLKVWINAGDDLRYERRINRDTHERGHSLDEVMTRYAEDVRPGFEKFIRPLRSQADVVFENNGRMRDGVPRIIDMLLVYIDHLSKTR